MARFKINDKIEHLKFDKVIAKGIVIAGPTRVDGIDHYTIKWEWDEDGIQWANMGSDIICDLPSAKYRYKLAQ